MSRWDQVVRKPEHEPLGPFSVYRQTTGACIVVDRRIKKLGEGIVASFRGERSEADALADARRRAALEGFVGKEWEAA